MRYGINAELVTGCILEDVGIHEVMSFISYQHHF